MKIFTIGFTQKSAEEFFGIIRSAGIQRLIDIRLNNLSQLAGFAKRDDLRYFLKTICDVEYIHEPLLAPTQEILDAYKKRKGRWSDYERDFLALMAERRIEKRLDRSLFSIPSVMLCSEPTADQCHRRLVAEYLREKWGKIEIKHL